MGVMEDGDLLLDCDDEIRYPGREELGGFVVSEGPDCVNGGWEDLGVARVERVILEEAVRVETEGVCRERFVEVVWGEGGRVRLMGLRMFLYCWGLGGGGVCKRMRF